MKPPKSIWILSPLVGSLVFAILYIVAAQLYPGGSQFDKNSVGFNWLTNYWCNLLNKTAINGQLNSGRPVAIIGMVSLCITLALFWFLFPIHVPVGRNTKRIIQVSGLLATVTALFLGTDYHDLITNLASVFGVVAVIGTFVGLYKSKWYRLLWFGILNVLLVGVNNYVYYTKGLLIYLPVVQKVSFLAFLSWICSINLVIYWQKDQNID